MTMSGDIRAATRVAFFGHNVSDAAVRRRALAFLRAGVEVSGFMPRRGEPKRPDWPNVDLGETRDNDYAWRLVHIFSGSRRAAQHAALLRDADLIYARNLDMLAMAHRTRRLLGLDVPLVYECLDIHHRLVGQGAVAKALRRFERRLLQDCALVVVSSPRFESEHFTRHYSALGRCHLIENRLIEGDAFDARPANGARPQDGPLRIGWFGNLRCRRSFDLLSATARQFPCEVEIVLRGYPARSVFPDFEAEVAGIPNIEFHGRYSAPEDLARIYDDIDVVWAADWYEAGANSLWLLPNRIYEGGYFATPSIAVAGTETARWIDQRDAGFVIGEPVERSLPDLVRSLIADRAPILARRNSLLSLSRDTFVEGPETTLALLAAAGC